jgi:competence protein ComEC
MGQAELSTAPLLLLPVVVLLLSMPRDAAAVIGIGPARAPLFMQRVTIILGALVAGVAAASLHAASNPVPSLLAIWEEHGFESRETPVSLTGRLTDIEVIAERRAALRLRILAFELPGHLPFRGAPTRPVAARLTVPLPPRGDPDMWRPGDLVEVTARIGPPKSFANPGAFDYARYLRTRGIHLTGTIKSPQLVRFLARGPIRLRPLAAEMRHAIVGRLRHAAGAGGETSSAFLAALLVGERSDLPDELERTLLRAGVFHIVALSGLNVGLVAMLVAGILRLLPLNGSWRRVLASAAVIAYWLIARESGSISRATLMVVLYLVGGASGRAISPLGTIAVSAILLLMGNPEWATDAGFQLTFGATFGILLLGSRRPSSRRSRGRAGHFMRGVILRSFRISAAALAGTTLITAYHFHTVTPVAILANLVAVPIASLLLLIGIGIAAADSLIPLAARCGAAVAGWLLQFLEFTCRIVSTPPGLSFHVLPPSLALVLAGCAAVLAAGLLRSKWRVVALACLIVSLALTVAAGRRSIEEGRLELAVLDVGQGDALLVRCPNGSTLLVDTGGFRGTEFDVGDRVVAPALRALGHLRLDVLAITHAHRDHLGGAVSILEQFSPRAVWLGKTPEAHPDIQELERVAGERGSSIVQPLRGVSLDFGGLRLRVLHPRTGRHPAPSPRNDDSLVLLLEFGQRALLLTGDLEEAGESGLVDAGERIEAELLKVGHHGSRTSTTSPFLARVDPDLAVISVGSFNPWRHPDSEVLDRLRESTITVYRTDRHGALLFSTDGTGPWRVRRLGPRTESSGRLIEDDRRGGDEAEHEDHQGEEGDEDAADPQPVPFVQDRRVPRTDDREDQAE